MNLARFPRRRYTEGRTPIEKLSRLSAELGGPTIYIKRDDLLGLTSGGNKTRKLEFLVADALDKGADTLVTCGAVQSNHCRLTLAAAVKEGLKCRLVLEERVERSYDADASGNNFLFRLLGVEEVRVVPGGSKHGYGDGGCCRRAQIRRAEALCDPRRRLQSHRGDRLRCVRTRDIVADVRVRDRHRSSGDGKRKFGNARRAGHWLRGANASIPVVGINVSRPKDAQEEKVYDLVRQTSGRLGVRSEIPRDKVLCFGDYVGPGYSLPTPEMGEAIRMLARLEDVLLDPVYTGKTMAGLIDLARKGFFKKDENILFIHTGGSPALYAYRENVLD